MRFKHRLFGNIKFVGELNRRNLLQESIIFSVFDMLLAIETSEQQSFVNDDTVEGACVLMNKVGHIIDEKLRKIELIAKEASDPNSSVKLKKADKQALKFH